MKQWRPDLAAAFEAICRLVQLYGAVEPWPPVPAVPLYRNSYLILDGHKYWGMAPRGDRDRIEERTVLNRATLS